jgi:ribonuclease BN (tRNA processing enzyme)
VSIRVLGCSGSIARGCRTTSFLLDDDILIDAGTGVGDLEIEELARIDHILLTHSHLDHILGVPLLADTVMRRRFGRPPIQVYALPETLSALRKHVFNNAIWPDFTQLPSEDRPVLALNEVAVGRSLTLGAKQREIEVLPAKHSVPAVGYAVSGSQGWWVFTGDTGPNPALWVSLGSRSVCDMVIEVAFPDEERELAERSRHHSPSSLVTELQQLAMGARVHFTHCKPGEMSEIQMDLALANSPHRPQALAANQTFFLG